MKIDPRELDRWLSQDDNDLFDGDERKEKLYDEGYEAFQRGLKEADVPYKKGSIAFQLWLDGYRDAKIVKEAEKRMR